MAGSLARAAVAVGGRSCPGDGGPGRGDVAGGEYREHVGGDVGGDSGDDAADDAADVRRASRSRPVTTAARRAVAGHTVGCQPGAACVAGHRRVDRPVPYAVHRRW